MPLYIFECPQHGRVELLRPVGTSTVECAEDGEPMPRVYGYAVALGTPEVDTRNMFRRFTEASAELEHQGYQGPSLWRAGQQRARAMIEAGENPVGRQW